MTDTTHSAFAIVTGGGTAGHVMPALAIADALVAAGHPLGSVHYVGSERGIEARLVPSAGYPMTLLPGRGIQRRIALANLGAVWGLAVAVVRALRLVRRLRPAVVVSVGGYASVAVSLAAVLQRVPIVVAEQNAVPGAANRVVARFAKASAVSFPDTALPRAVITGNPVREEVARIDPDRDRPASRVAAGSDPHRHLVLVMGGSLGARRINEAVLDALPLWRDRADLAVHHVVGRRDWDAISAAAPSDLGALEYRAVPYEDEMPTLLAGADLAVCRSGSSTCFELASVGLPAVLVPSPHVTADQQTRNARHLVDAGAAVLVADDALDGARLAEEIDRLLADDGRRAAMSAAGRAWSRPAAAASIAALAEEHARG